MHWACCRQCAQCFIVREISKIKHGRLQRLGGLLTIFATGFASGTQHLPNIGEVAERDRGLLSNGLLASAYRRH